MLPPSFRYRSPPLEDAVYSVSTVPGARIFFLAASATTTAENSPCNTIYENLIATYHVEPLPRWSLDHRLFRETAPSEQTFGKTLQNRTANARYLQVLTLTKYAEVTHVAFTSNRSTADGTSGRDGVGDTHPIVTIPIASSESYIQLMVTKLGPLWTLRQALQLGYGQAYEIGNIIIRFGDVRQGQGGAQQIRGTVVEIESNGDEDAKAGAEIIRTFWLSLGIEGAREHVKDQNKEDRLENVRQWLEALRLRT